MMRAHPSLRIQPEIQAYQPNENPYAWSRRQLSIAIARRQTLDLDRLENCIRAYTRATDDYHIVTHIALWENTNENLTLTDRSRSSS